MTHEQDKRETQSRLDAANDIIANLRVTLAHWVGVKRAAQLHLEYLEKQEPASGDRS